MQDNLPRFEFCNVFENAENSKKKFYMFFFHRVPRKEKKKYISVGEVVADLGKLY